MSGELPRVVLGRTGIEVSGLGYGAGSGSVADLAPVGRPVDTDAAEALLHAVLDAGIDYIDTAPDYGRSEELIGRFLGRRRDEFVVATKCGCVPEDVLIEHVFTPEHIRSGVERSLRRMRTDHLDVVQFHFSPSRRILERDGAIEELQRLQAEGKVRAIGMSGTLPHITDHVAMGVFDVFQIPYSGTEREHEAVIDAAAAAGAGVVVRGGMSSGVLSAGGAPGAGAPGRRPPADAGQRFWFVDRTERQARLARADVRDLLGPGMSMSQFMLRFAISHPGVHTAIVGTKSLDHLRSNVAAVVAGPLPPDVYEAAKQRFV